MEERQARELVRCKLIPSCLLCPFRAQPGARLGEKSPCISKVKILRAANENWLGETSPLLQQRFRRELSREVRENIEKARGLFSIGSRRKGDRIGIRSNGVTNAFQLLLRTPKRLSEMDNQD